MKIFDAVVTLTITLVCVVVSVVMLWAAWRLAEGEMFFACCGMFTAAFWGAVAGCLVWGGICNWKAPNNLPPASTLYPDIRP